MNDKQQFNAEMTADAVLEIAEASTLSGDIRDALLTHLRAIKVPWAMLAEDEQQSEIEAISKTAEHCVRQCCALMAQAGAPHVHAKISKWTVKGGDLKLELAVTPLVENMIALAEHGSRGAVLVLADAADFMGERAPAKPDPDQPDLPMPDSKAA
jgi:hypothetical protein